MGRLISTQVSGETLGEVKVVRDMHERKAEMAKHADAFIALPGRSLGQRPALSIIIILSFWIPGSDDPNN